MFCENCGNKIIEGAPFCQNCRRTTLQKPNVVLSSHIDSSSERVKSENISKFGNSNEVIIKCGNCEYIGAGEPARSLFFKIVAWVCVFFFFPITIIYYLATNKYRCPKCKSTFLGIKNYKGIFMGQRSGAKRIFLWIIIGIVIIFVLSTLILLLAPLF